ncbi:hypothetical protein Sango_2530500 [Sesamum angolense]|uniref:Uncharacterized protein n=1 Tax=Sesamum angolense TaxID=2727404 RepID=A0AAE2BIH7_9LAMI|nr:hypothetical protein Sango_2530500 [Sesamum angolense]
MEEETTSWIRRTNFSHTVCHRFDSSRLASVPFTVVPNRFSGNLSRPEGTRAKLRTGPNVVHIQNNPSTNKPRAVSPNQRLTFLIPLRKHGRIRGGSQLQLHEGKSWKREVLESCFIGSPKEPSLQF